MTFTIVVYDVASSKNQEVLTFLRTHMNWIQNSVFEADLTEAELRRVKEKLESIVGSGDSAVIYQAGSKKYVEKKVIGTEKGSSDQII